MIEFKPGHCIVTKLSKQQILDFAEEMQQADKDSIKKLVGWSPIEGLAHSLFNSHEIVAWTVNDKVAAVFGISGAADSRCAWCLCSDLIQDYPSVFLRFSKTLLRLSVDKYGTPIQNLVDADHTASIRWLQWLGYDVYENQVKGIKGDPFHLNILRA